MIFLAILVVEKSEYYYLIHSASAKGRFSKTFHFYFNNEYIMLYSHRTSI